MHKCDEKVAPSFGEISSATICKIQNMPWLKRNISASANPKSNEDEKLKMLKNMPEKEKEQKDKKKHKKHRKPSTGFPPQNDVKFRGNNKSMAEGQKNHQTGRRDLETPKYSFILGKSENVWNSARNAAGLLFPNVESKETEDDDDEILKKVLKESEETAFLERCAIDPSEDEAAQKYPEEPEVKAEWGKVQRNLPLPEPEKELNIFDPNNNSGAHPVEHLTIPSAKLERRSQNLSGEAENKKNMETPLVPAITPSYIDKYGRVDGCNEKRVFMGKGARFKEQVYLKQQQQQQQLKGSISLPETPILPSNSSETPADQSNAFTSDSQTSSDYQNEALLDEACGYSQDFTGNRQELNSLSDVIVNQPQHFSRSVDEVISEMEAISSLKTSDEAEKNLHIPEHTPTQSHQDFTPVGRPIVSGSNSNNYQQKRHQSFGISVNMGIYHAGNVRERSFNKSHEPNVGKTFGPGKRNDYGAPKDDRNPRRSQGELNSYRNARYEQNPHKYGEQNRGHQNGPRGDQNFHKCLGEQKRDFHSGPRYDQSFRKWQADQKRDFQSGPRADQIPHKSDDLNRDLRAGLRGDGNSCKADGERKRYNPKLLTADTNPFKPVGESIKNDNSNEYRGHSQIEKASTVSLQELSKEETHTRPADVATDDSRRSFQNVPVEDEPNDTSSNISEIPDISNFASRFSVPPSVQDFPMEMISVPPVIPPPANSFSVATTHYYPEISNPACVNDNLQYSSSQFQAPPGFQLLERPARPSSVSCASEGPLEVRYANLLHNDPLLFRLLQQRQMAKPKAPVYLPNPENSNENQGNRTVYGNCPNCSCNSQLSKNFSQETTNPNAKISHSEEEERAAFQTLVHSNVSPFPPYLRNPVAAQHPETLQMGNVKNAEGTTTNIQHPNIPFLENPHIVYYRDPSGQIFSMVINPHQHMQRAINVQPRGEECQGFLLPAFQHPPPDFQSPMLQNIYDNQYENATSYPRMNKYAQQRAQMPMPFPPDKYNADIATMSRGNVVVQGNPGGYREAEYHQTFASTGVEWNDAIGNEETGRAFPRGTGAGKKKNFRPVPIESRGRPRLTQRN